jgi:hypothetical protein
MKQHNMRTRFFLIGVLFPLVFSGCLKFRSTEDVNPASQPQMRVTMKEVYQGVKDGNTESVQLPIDSAFITIRICLENLSTVQESVYWQDVFLDLGDNIRIYPVALGYDQAEAFSWLLPIAAPIGAKSIDHKFYFFVIQKNELVRIPAYQSLGCDNSAQFKSLALLFIVKKERVGEPYILKFLGASLPFTAKKVSPLSLYVIWGFGLGIFIVIAAAVLLLRKRKLKKQAALLPQQNEDSPRES